MRSLHQIGKKIKAIFLYLLYYCLGSLIAVTIFAWIYSLKGIINSWQISFEIFWTIENYKIDEIIYWTYAERIMNDLFSVILVGTVLAHLLKPLNPILFANYVAYDTVDRKMVFKYWIMLPKDQYLYDTRIKLFLADYETHQQGINKISPVWEVNENEDRLNLNMARGIRFVELTEKESSDLMKSIENLYNKHVDEEGKYVGGEIVIDFSIRGTDESGTTYHNWHKYKLDDILLGYRYVPMQRHSYYSRDFYREVYLNDEEKRNLNASEDFYQSGKKEFFRYQHFDKVYRLKSSAKSEKAEKNHDVLSENQIKHGQYRGLHQLILDLLSFITWFYLDSNKKMSWVLKKIGEYLLHITHIRRF